MSTRWTKKCHFCGENFSGERSSGKFCPDKPCRQKYHRERVKSIETPLKQACDAIRTLGRAYEGNFSYEAAEALDTIAKSTAFFDVAVSSTWWRCRKCKLAIQKELPERDGCQAGGNHEWHYQKTMF